MVVSGESWCMLWESESSMKVPRVSSLPKFAFLSFVLLCSIFTAAQSPQSPKISDFVLYAERSIKMGHHSHTEGGEVGVRTAMAKSRPGVAQLQLEEHAKCGTVFSPSTSMENDAEIGKIWTNSLKRVKDTEI